MNPRVTTTLAAKGCWAIEEQAASAYLDRLDRLQASDLAPPQAFWDDDRTSGRGYTLEDGGIAVLSISGPLSKEETCASWLFGGTSTVRIRQALRSAIRDPKVAKVVLLLDSPGGEVAGTADLAEDVQRLGAEKPIIAYASDLCASAAYWIGSQASEFYGNSTAQVGSIGVYMAVRDTSEATAKQGVKVHVIRTGSHKGAGVAGTPITEDHLDDWQRVVDDLNTQFVSAVARGRGMSFEEARKLADGRVHVGQHAVDLGLLDGIHPLDHVLDSLRGSIATGGKSASSSTHPTDPDGSGASHKETNMKLIDKVKAFFGENPDIAMQAGITQEDLADSIAQPAAPAPAAVDPAIQKQIEAANAQLAAVTTKIVGDAAASFADQAIRAKRAFPGERASLEALYRQAAASDGEAGAPMLSADGSVREGANVKAVRDAVAARPAHKLFEQEIPDEAPKGSGIDDDERKRLLAMTGTGRAVLSQEAK